ncbi:ESPR-type extended signal peptide-containing protein, partial [Gallibacterium anatis]|uniref:ESPR-type extended signal peptide-containing protein n=1 Tax=Gallibacterium anatis TaxID=750 RepID=UPI0039FD0AAD
MNKIYKVIFNRNKNRYEIVSELASSRGGKCKVKAGKQIAKLFMTGLLATFLSSVALAADEEVKVKYDAATGTIKIVKVSDGSEVASYAVGGNISPITSIGTEKGAEKDTKNPTGIIAMGDQSKAVQSNSIAIGANAHAGDNLTPAKGKDYPEDNSTGYIAIGTKAVASGERSISLGNESSTNKGSYNIVQGNDSIGIGTSTSVFGYSGVSIGRRNIIGVPDPDLVKEGVLTTKARTKYSENDLGGNSVIVGAYNVAYGNRSSIIGTYSRAMGSNSVAIGSGVQSLSDGSIAIGKGSGYEFEDGSRFKNGEDVTGDYYGRDWELPPEYKVLKQVLSNDINGDKPYKKSSSTRKGYRYEKGGSLPKYNNYGAGSSDPGGFIVEGENALGIGTYTQVRGNSAIGLATGEMTADLSEMDKSQYARDMRKIMDMEETLYDAKEALKSDSTSDKATLEANVKTAEESLAAAKKEFRKNYLSKYSFVEGEGALGVGRQILAQGDRSMAVGDYAKAISNDAIAYGGQTLANGTNSMAMGGSAHVGTTDKSFDNSMAIGSHTNVQAGNAVALGAFSQVTGQNSLALGFGKQSGDAITYNSVSGKDSTLIGSYGTVKGNNSILIGSNGNIANDRVVGLGNNINIEAADQNDQENNTAGSVFLGDHAGYVKDSKRSRSLGQVDVVGSAGKMELTESLSSTKGALRDYTKDFIYIYMLERQDDGTQIGAPIAVRSDFAGGDSTVGVVSVGSTYEQQFNSLQDIKDYHTKMGSLITVPVDVTVQVTKNGVSLGEQQQTRYFAADSTREEIYADSTLKEADKEKVWNAIQSKTSTPNTTYTVFETRRIQNVAPGLIGLNSTDAINGSQLFATNQMLGNLVGSLKKTFGDNVTITEDGQIKVSGEGTLGWIAKANTVDGSNGKVTYDVDKETDETEEAYQARKAKLQKDGYIVDAAKVMTFKAGKNIGLVQKPGEFSISTIDTPSFKSVELRGDEKTVDGKKVTEVTKIDSSGMKVVTETSTPASDGSTTPTVTEKVSTTVGKDGVSTDGSVKVTNGTTDLVTIDKGTDDTGTDQEYGKIGLDGKNGSNATITVDRGTSSLDDTKNIGGTDPKQDISENNPAKMDRITYTTKDKDNNDVTHEVATMDDGLFFSGDSADGENNNVKNKFDRKLSQETKIIGGVDLGLTDSASAKERQEAIAAKLTDGNIGVISDGTDTLTVKLAKQLTGLDSTTYTSPTTKTDDGEATSTMKVDGNGIRFVGDKDTVKNDAPSLTADGITGGNKTITDVASGIGGKVEDPDKNNANTFLENVNKIGKKDGDQPAADAISENVVVNAKDLKNLVDTGFKLNTSGQGTAGASTVKIGDTINVVDGANTKVSAITAEDGTHTFHMDVNGLPMSYVTTDGKPVTKIGDKFYKTEDLENGTPKPNKQPLTDNEVSNNISLLDKTGNTTAAPQIKNVGSGLINNNSAISPSDLLNITDMTNPVLKNAVNVGDLKNVAAAAKTEVTGTGKAIVTNTTAQDGHTIYNVHVDPVVNVVAADGKTQVVRGDDGKYYDPEDIENKTFVPDGKGGGNWYNTSDIGDNGQPNTGASVQNINPVDVKNNFVNPNGTGSIVVDNVKSGIGGKVDDPEHEHKNTFIKNLDKVGKPASEGGIDKTTVVNAGDL